MAVFIFLIMKQIKLTQGQVAWVDDEDYERVNQFKWYALRHGNTFYAARGVSINGKQTLQLMHRFIIGEDAKKPYTDHKDGDGLNNQRNNLRHCTNQENMMNRKKVKNCSSKYKGVHCDKYSGKWRACIQINGKKIHLGYFDIEDDAARAYNVAAIKYFGDFKKLNFS